MWLIPSVALLTNAISSAPHSGPSSAAHFPRMRVKSSSLCAGLGEASSRSIAAFTRSITARGDAPSPAVLK